MNIDIERLKVDADYWEKCGAPEDATHYDPGGEWDEPSFMKFGDECMFLDDASNWDYYGEGADHSSKDVKERSIPRPTKQSQEWDGESFPIPAGAECEVQMGSFWYPGVVIASTAEAAWFKADDRGDFWTVMNGLSIRPLRSKKQREREELIAILDGIRGFREEEFVDAILAKYELKERTDDH